MLKMSSFNEVYFREQAAKSKNNNLSNQQKLGLGITTASLAGIGVCAGIKGKKASLFKALEKQGIELKNGVAILKESGEKFTGNVKRNVKSFGLRKETIHYDNGVMTERVCHNIWGKEVCGDFYKDGVLRISIPGIMSRGKRKAFPIYTYDKTGKPESLGDNFGTEMDSVFAEMRRHIKDLK